MLVSEVREILAISKVWGGDQSNTSAIWFIEQSSFTGESEN